MHTSRRTSQSNDPGENPHLFDELTCRLGLERAAHNSLQLLEECFRMLKPHDQAMQTHRHTYTCTQPIGLKRSTSIQPGILTLCSEFGQFSLTTPQTGSPKPQKPRTSKILSSWAGSAPRLSVSPMPGGQEFPASGFGLELGQTLLLFGCLLRGVRFVG